MCRSRDGSKATCSTARLTRCDDTPQKLPWSCLHSQKAPLPWYLFAIYIILAKGLLNLLTWKSFLYPLSFVNFLSLTSLPLRVVFLYYRGSHTTLAPPSLAPLLFTPHLPQCSLGLGGDDTFPLMTQHWFTIP